MKGRAATGVEPTPDAGAQTPEAACASGSAPLHRDADLRWPMQRADRGRALTGSAAGPMSLTIRDAAEAPDAWEPAPADVWTMLAEVGAVLTHRPEGLPDLLLPIVGAVIGCSSTSHASQATASWGFLRQWRPM